MIGIGISTRNRPSVLKWSLEHFDLFPARYKSKYLVVDDNSTTENAELNRQICKTFGVSYIYNEERKGVAGTKNICGNSLTDCKYLFLFDDDTFPRAKNWDFIYVYTTEQTNIKHLNYIREVDHIRISQNFTDYTVYKDCMGCMCFFTKDAWKQLKGFDESYGLFGFEHADISQRAQAAGLCKGLKGYYAPKDASKYIYNLDTDFKTLNEVTVLGIPPFMFASSTRNEPVQEYIQSAAKIFQQKRIY